MYKRLLSLSLLLSMEVVQSSQRDWGALVPSRETGFTALKLVGVTAFSVGGGYLGSWLQRRNTPQPVAAEGTATLEFDGLDDDAQVTGKDLRRARIQGVAVLPAQDNRADELKEIVKLVGQPVVFADDGGAVVTKPTGLFAVQENQAEAFRLLEEFAERLTAVEGALADRKVDCEDICNQLGLPVDNGERAGQTGKPMHERVKTVEGSIGNLDEQVGTLFDDIGIPGRRPRAVDQRIATQRATDFVDSRRINFLFEQMGLKSTGDFETVNDGETIAARMQKVEGIIDQQETASQVATEYTLWLKEAKEKLDPVLAAVSTKFAANGSAVESAAESDWRERIATVERDLATLASKVANKVGTDAHSKAVRRIDALESASSGGSQQRRR